MESRSRKEIINYQAPWTIYSLSWCHGIEDYCTQSFRMAIGSFKEEYSNQVQIIQLVEDHDAGEADSNHTSHSFKPICQFDHPYPATKLMWAPQSSSAQPSSTDLLATSGDYLRLWGVDGENKVELKRLFNSTKDTDYCAPITSFDWNEVDTSVIGAVSIDTTCTIWDINKSAPVAQLIAHDKEVFDIAFAGAKDVFGTVSADGQVRMFDLRALEHSTVVYESPDLSPLLRLAWNKRDPNYLATILTDSSKAVILDIRVPDLPVAELTGCQAGHSAAINGVAWAPTSHSHVCTVADDRQVLIWDVEGVKQGAGAGLGGRSGGGAGLEQDPVLQYTAQAAVNNVEWSACHKDWVAICFENNLQVLKI